MDSHLLELGPCCTMSAPSKLEQCSERIAAGLLMASEANMALHSLTSLSIWDCTGEWSLPLASSNITASLFTKSCMRPECASQPHMLSISV